MDEMLRDWHCNPEQAYSEMRFDEFDDTYFQLYLFLHDYIKSIILNTVVCTHYCMHTIHHSRGVFLWKHKKNNDGSYQKPT